ncbi:hypothetical protein L3X38_035727 [Prunus dulcis]|uniref:Uncharacterized protein n=1 Tax=Prunus dulcis TaxID=3755 RepID=A0AAD4VLK1_PRUDU|nr:hypothetical protein L3X38_035727 [Prunus dulcis]
MVGSIKYVGVVILFEHLNLEDDPLALHHSLMIFGYLARNMRLPASHNHFRVLSLKRQNQSDIKTRKASIVFGLCCFWVLQQPQHRRLLDSHHLRGPSYCPLRCWFCFVLVASCFANNKVRNFCNLLQRSAGLAIFVSCLTWDFSLLVDFFEAQSGCESSAFVTFCYLFFLQSADLEFCSAEGGLSM